MSKSVTTRKANVAHHCNGCYGIISKGTEYIGLSEEAKYYLGLAYYYGRGIYEDEDEGVSLIRDAAEGYYEPAREWMDDNGFDYDDD